MDATVAVGLCVFFLVLFVGLLYVTAAGRGDRDSVPALRARFTSVGVACVISALTVAWSLPADSESFWQVTGLWPKQGVIMSTLLPLTATVCLFLGPLFQTLWENADEWTVQQSGGGRDTRQKLIWVRNYVVAPVAEEWVFRACMCPLLRMGGFSFAASVLVPPLLFGVAHAHHVFGILRERGATRNYGQVAVQILFQLGYTTVFGSMAAYYLLCTGGIFGAMLSHAFCNAMGFPDFSGALESKRRWALVALYVAGVAGFFALMRFMGGFEMQTALLIYKSADRIFPPAMLM